MTDRPLSTPSAVLFDFGGVLTTSPFEAFSRYEQDHGLPKDFIRSVNARDSDANPLARLERREITVERFADEFEAASRAHGHAINGSVMLELIRGDIRPEMIEAVRRCAKAGKVGLLTNNFVPMASAAALESGLQQILDLFDTLVESAVEGVRKPEPRFYEIACERLSIDPADAVFLDDLGVNLKPARLMGMTTIKVLSGQQAIADLEQVTGLKLAVP